MARQVLKRYARRSGIAVSLWHLRAGEETEIMAVVVK